MLEMSAFSFVARSKTFAKTQNRFSNCFIEQIVPDSQLLNEVWAVFAEPFLRYLCCVY